jgi:hypothetical protein
MVDGPDERVGSFASDPPPFDSMANIRALGDIQRRGLEAANVIAGRLIEQIDRGGPLFGAEPSVTRANGDQPLGTRAGMDLMNQYFSLMSSFFGALFGAPTGRDNSFRSVDTPTSSVAADPVTLSPTPAGSRAEGELWLHNRSGSPVADVRVHSGDLRRHDGAAVPASVLRFDPELVEELPDLTSRGIRVTVDVPEGTPPGRYWGTLLAANLPDLWLPIELDVLATPS